MNEWAKNHGKIDGSIHSYIGSVEIRYRDRYNVTRTALGLSFPPFGVSVDGVDGSKLPGAEHNAWEGKLDYVPYGRILYWRTAETQ